MIEQSHLRAMRLVTKRLEQAGDDINQAQIAAKQIVAITELEQTRRAIFAKYGVPDPEALLSSTGDKRLDLILQRLQIASPLTMNDLAEISGIHYDEIRPLIRPYIQSGQIRQERRATIGRFQYFWVGDNRQIEQL